MKVIKLLLPIALLLITMSARAQFTSSVRLLSEYGTAGNKNFCVGATYTAGYQINDILLVGVGTGISYTDLLFEPAHYEAIIHYYSNDYKETGAYVPVFATLKVNFCKTKVKPYFALDLGYSFLIPFSTYAKEYVNLGSFVSPLIGVEFSLNKGSIGIESGFKYQLMRNSALSNNNLDYGAATLGVVYNF